MNKKLKFSRLDTLHFRLILLPFLIALCSFLPAQKLLDTIKKDTIQNVKPQGKKNYELGEEMITGKASFKISEPKIYFIPMLDFFGPINELLKSDEFIFDEKLAFEIDSRTLPTPILRSSYLRIPLKGGFLYGDVLIFLPEFEKSVASWELVISNSLGETVRRIAQTGDPPPIISWDGRTETKEMLVTGEIYTFTFNTYDALGNQTRIFGKPQKISGIVYEENGKTIINIAGDEVFIRGTDQLNESLAFSRIAEATNIIKERFKSKKTPVKEVIIYVYTEKEELSLKQCNILKDEFNKRIILPQEALKVIPRFIPGLKPKYSKIEIIIH